MLNSVDVDCEFCHAGKAVVQARGKILAGAVIIKDTLVCSDCDKLLNVGLNQQETGARMKRLCNRCGTPYVPRCAFYPYCEPCDPR